MTRGNARARGCGETRIVNPEKKGKKCNKRQSATLRTSRRGPHTALPSVTPSPHKISQIYWWQVTFWIAARLWTDVLQRGVLHYHLFVWSSDALKKKKKKRRKISSVVILRRLLSLKVENCRQCYAECNCSCFVSLNRRQHCKSHETPTTFLLHSCIQRGLQRGERMPRCQTSGGNMSNSAFMWCGTISVPLHFSPTTALRSQRLSTALQTGVHKIKQAHKRLCNIIHSSELKERGSQAIKCNHSLFKNEDTKSVQHNNPGLVSVQISN